MVGMYLINMKMVFKLSTRFLFNHSKQKFGVHSWQVYSPNTMYFGSIIVELVSLILKSMKFSKFLPLSHITKYQLCWSFTKGSGHFKVTLSIFNWYIFYLHSENTLEVLTTHHCWNVCACMPFQRQKSAVSRETIETRVGKVWMFPRLREGDNGCC